METPKRLKQVHTINGATLLDLNEIIGIFPKESRDSNPYIILRCGVRIYFEEYHLTQLKTELNKL